MEAINMGHKIFPNDDIPGEYFGKPDCVELAILPINKSNFEEIRSRKMVYVDKTTTHLE